MFWIASANPNTSRPQPLACDIGVRNKPSVERGPKLNERDHAAARTITAGVRQPMLAARERKADEIAMAEPV